MMQISNILSKLSSSEKPQDVFLALEITSEFVVAALWTVLDGKTKLLKVGPGKEWEEEKELLLAVDESLSTLLLNFSGKIKGVIFGLEESWVKENTIRSDKQILLKKVCQKLELKPLGFVVIVESLIQYLKITEGPPLSAVLVKLEQTQATISLVKLGKIVKSELVGRSDDLSSDLKEALARFGDIDSFPSRILLYDGLVDFEEARQQLTSYDWPTELPFLHYPKVEIMERNISIKSIAIAGGSEIAKAMGFEINMDKENIKDDEPRKEPLKEKSNDEIVKESDETMPEAPEAENNKGKKEETDKLSALGFLAEKDITKETLVEKTEEPKKVKTDNFIKPKTSLEENDKEDNEGKQTSELKNKSGVFTRVLSIFAGLKKIPNNLMPKKTVFIILLPFAFLLLFFALLILAYWFFPKAELTLYFKDELVEQDLTVLADSKITDLDLSFKILPVKEKTIEIEGNKSINTTGEILIGDKASGRVALYNKTDIVKTFPVNTVLFSNDDLKFFTQEKIEVASKSAQESVEGEQVVYGKKEVSLSAASIGPEYNLKKDTEFSLDDFSKNSFAAQAIEDFSGGTSRSVSAISQEDQDRLIESLKEELINKAQLEFNQESEGEKIFSDPKQAKVLAKEFDKEEGDEGDNLSLILKLALSSFSYKESDLNILLSHYLLSLIPEGFDIKKTEIVNEKVVSKNEEGKSEITVSLKAVLIPKLNLDDVRQSVKGKYPNIAQDYFNTLPNFVRADIKIYPKFFPSKLLTFPRRAERIQINIETIE